MSIVAQELCEIYDRRMVRRGSEQGALRRVVAANVRRLRGERGWSQDALAQQAGVTKQAVYQVEGSKRYASEGLLEALAEAFGVPPTAFFAELDAERELQITPALSQFLDQFPEQVSPEERRALAGWRPPARRPTQPAFHLYLLALRATEPAKPASREVGPESTRHSRVRRD